MKQGHRTGWTFVAAATLALAFSWLPSGTPSRPAARGAERGAYRLAAGSRSDPGRSSEARHPGTPARGAVEARRDDGRSRRPAPESRATFAAARRGSWRADRVPAAVGDRHASASAALFHEAHAPPEGLSTVAGSRS